MKAIRKSDGCEVSVVKLYPEKINDEQPIPYYRDDGTGEVYYESDLDFNLPSEKESAVIEGWVAVDDFDNAYIYHSKPAPRTEEFCDTGDCVTHWDCDTKYPNGKRCYVIDKDFFPDLTPESEPQKVRIQITPME